jgi:hypothetical protein
MNPIEISDHPELGLKRKVFWHTFIFSEKEQHVKLFTICKHFQNTSGSYGDIFVSNAVKDFERILVASNSRKVNPGNGLVCNPNINGIFIDMMGNIVNSPMGQFDMFLYLIQNPLEIIPLVEGIIQQEDLFFHSYD